MTGPAPTPGTPAPKPRVPTPKVYGATPRRLASGPSPVLSGLFAAVAAGGLWALVVYVTHYMFGWAAWGVGALVGLAVRTAERKTGTSLGTTAAALAAGGLIFGHLLIHLFALQPIIEDEMLGNQAMINAAYLLDMVQRHAFSPELQPQVADSQLDSVPIAARRQMLEEAIASAMKAPLAERKVVVHRVVTAVSGMLVQRLGFSRLFRAEFSGWDLLWFALAISTAWRLATRGSPAQHAATVEDEHAARLAEERRMRQEQVRRAHEQADRDQKPAPP